MAIATKLVSGRYPSTGAQREMVRAQIRKNVKIKDILELDKMTREEWYKHTTLDKVDSVCDYVQIMLDDAMETDMSTKDIEQLHLLLVVLYSDISKQLRRLEHD